MAFTILSDSNIKTLLDDLTTNDVSNLAEQLHQALVQYSCHNEQPYQPHRAHVKRPDGQVSLFMPSTTPESIGVKIVGVSPSQPDASPDAKLKPALQGTLTICDAYGQGIGVLNAASLTAMRTALASMLLYRYRKATSNIVVFGAGKQAEWHIRLAILLKGEDIKKITVVNRSRRRAQELVDALSVPSHITLSVFEGEGDTALEPLITDADVLFCTTPSTAPLFPASFLTSTSAREKTRFIAAIGSYRLDMAEIDPELLKSMTDASGPFKSQVYRESIAVDSIAGCMAEAGELVSAGVKEEQMLEVGRIADVDSDMRRWLEEGFVVYKLVGMGIMDIAIGRALMGMAKEKGVGVHLDSF
jgi:ornithine cyclodeaminase/alanine dehydrogenase-like protein (mu-crystallin family)